MKRSAAPELHLSNQLCFPLYAASRLVTRLYQPMLSPLGITYTQYVVLLILWEQSPCKVTDIGQRALLESSTLTPLLKRLEQLGLVRRQRDTIDERVVQVQLTAAGEALRERCRCVPTELMRKIDFPLERANQIKGLLEELIASLAAADVSAEPES